jgi:chemotaxis protein methyltransferase CheR
VLGTDLNTASLDKARAGIYGRWSLREGMPEAARPFLTPLPDGRHEVAPEIRRLVRFEALNLAHDAGPDAALGATRLDVVLCRNVLIYFKAARARRVLARLAAALGPQGWLITNPVEIPAGGIEGMRLVHVGALVGLQRAAVGDAAMPAATAGTPAPPTRVRATRGTHPAALARTRATPAQAPQPAAPAPSQAAPAGAPDDLRTGQIRARADAGHLDQAEALCREAIARDKLNPEWTYLLSTILAERGATEEAAAALQRTLYLDRGHVLARFCLGGILLRGGETEAGLRQFAMALSQLAGLPPEQVIPGSGGLMVRELRAAIEQARSALEPR